MQIPHPVFDHCSSIVDATDASVLPILWADFDRLGLSTEWQTKACVCVAARSLLDEAVMESVGRLAFLLGQEECWITNRLFEASERLPSHRIEDLVKLFKFRGKLPEVVSSTPGRIFPGLKDIVGLRIWRAGGGNPMACLFRLSAWYANCTREQIAVVEEALVGLTGNKNIVEAILSQGERENSWRGSQFAYDFFEPTHLINLVSARIIDPPTLALLRLHPERSVVTAVTRILTSAEVISYLEAPECQPLPQWLVAELLERFPLTSSMGESERWVTWTRLLHKNSNNFEQSAEKMLLHLHVPDAVCRGLLACFSKERLFELLDAPADLAGKAMIEDELVGRFPESQSLSHEERWLMWMEPESGNQQEPDWGYYKRLACDPKRPLRLRQRALSVIPPNRLNEVASTMGTELFARLIDDLEFTGVSQRWCLEIAILLGESAVGAYRHVTDLRTIRSYMAPGQPRWLVEASARRLGVSITLPNLHLEGLDKMREKPALWIPRLLETHGEDVSSLDVTSGNRALFAGFVENIQELKAFPIKKGVYSRLMQESEESEETYFASTDLDAMTDPLFMRLNSPRYFKMRPGWVIDYEGRTYHGHHGEDRGTFISCVFTRRENAIFRRHLNKTEWSYYHHFFRDESPPESVAPAFDLDGIYLPNTAEALLELAAIIRLPTYSSINPTAWPENPPTSLAIRLGKTWSALAFDEHCLQQGEGNADWREVRRYRLHVELVVVWQPFPLFGVNVVMTESQKGGVY